ncbi:glycosyltransferase [Agromyces sp. GXQ0307]|uniref:glycosyltransferase n=1 Tax=Agromyces sp. GXQ0307 TaxID=3377835 RepID=UPI00383BBBB6
MARPRILCISFSDLRADARVLRQIGVLQEFGDVTTVSYGSAPNGVRHHLEIDRALPSLPQTVGGVLKLGLRAYRSVDLDAPAVRRARELIGTETYDLVVANEARALPLAAAVAGDAPVLGDMHEWAPEERSHVLSWRLLVSPYMRSVCRRYLPRIAAVTTVNQSIADLYAREFGVVAEVVRNASEYRDLSPTALDGERIRLVHSGGAVPGRSIETMIDAVAESDERFTLDLYLVGAYGSDAYLEQLRARAERTDRVTIHPPVTPDQLPSTLNGFDVGVFILPPRTTNHRLMLPNKLFDFVQARLGLIFSPAVETDALIARYGLGITTDGFGLEDLRRALAALTTEQVVAFKAASDRAAHELSSARDLEVLRKTVERLLVG